jgi:hypothetical protein
MIGQRFDYLLVIAHAEAAPNGRAQWLCVCDCGEERIVRQNNLKQGTTRSCGCRPAARKQAAVLVVPGGVPLTGTDLVSQLDPADATKWGRLRWRLNSAGYAESRVQRRGVITTVLLHRLVLGAAPGIQVDHINHDKLDNRRSNLRLATVSENSTNRRSRPHSSQFKGVSWDGRANRWVARHKKQFLGLFTSEEDAARAFDRAARSSSFAVLNFPEVLP